MQRVQPPPHPPDPARHAGIDPHARSHCDASVHTDSDAHSHLDTCPDRDACPWLVLSAQAESMPAVLFVVVCSAQRDGAPPQGEEA
jgi:hypothetical protein